MNNNPLKAAILIISDTAYADPSTDKTLPVLSNLFEEGDGNWVVSQRCIVPDNAAVIRTEVVDWCEKVGDDTVNLIVTSGGTGFAVRDQTPEAISPLIQKHAPGLM
jgi:gephyrin